MYNDITLIIYKMVWKSRIQPHIIIYRISDEEDYYADQRIWQYCQGLVLLELKPNIPDSYIKFSADGVYGAYLKLKLGYYKIKFGIEDVRSINEYKEHKVITIEIDKNTINFAQGFVETMEEAAILVDHLRENQIENALRILYRLQSYPKYKIPRSSEEIEIMVTQTLL